MNTGSHLLGAFNIDFDSFVDNVVFCALIDRVGKYQLAMQKVSAYQPMAESMPQMLREEAFHLAAGVVPMRRWVTAPPKGGTSSPWRMLQKAINKWVPRACEMFGDERGGGTNVRLGLKPMKNSEAQKQYYEEVGKLVRDLNLRYLRARIENLSTPTPRRCSTACSPARPWRACAGRTSCTCRTPSSSAAAASAGLPHGGRRTARRSPPPPSISSTWSASLPESYRASRDFKEYVESARPGGGGAMKAEEAAPASSRPCAASAGACPCSKSVRWVVGRAACRCSRRRRPAGLSRIS